LSPVKKWIFGNATKISFLDKLLSGVSKLLVGTVDVDKLQVHNWAPFFSVAPFP
jgi:hypothetical protein